nr:activating signal cointegrator 1 complex subunit 2 homolog [Danio rerio]|eukprot:XP_021332241.1 activating signal cointegrator 1 complex subunit 2 homolog [Danio rerio]
MPHQNQQHVEVVASREQNRIPEPQPEEQQQNEPERPQQRDLIINGRVRGVLRGLQSARPLRRMREQQDEAFVNQMPHQNQQHVEVVASRGQNRIPEPQPEEQQQNEPERPQQRDLVINGRVCGVLRGLQSARPLRRMREQVSQSLLSLRIKNMSTLNVLFQNCSQKKVVVKLRLKIPPERMKTPSTAHKG